MPLAPDQRIGHYKIVAMIGKGGMGEVYRARDTKLGRDVAIKVLPPALVADPERLARFEREARVLAALNHPNIAGIYGLEEHAIVMELVEGPTLAERISAGPIPLAESLRIAAQIADALEAAHEKGIIHRDLKPANVKAPVDGTVKVLDLGLATAIPSTGREEGDPEHSPTLTMAATEAGVILGTAAYMSPEQASGKRADKRADIWSFGVVLWEMLRGKRLFSGGETVSHTLADVLRSPIDFKKLPESTPAPIVELLKRCLDRNVKTRLRDIGEARVAIAKYLADPSGHDEDEPERSGAATGAWVVAAVCAALAGALAFVHFREAPPPAPRLQTQIAMPEKTTAEQFALSSDGRIIAIVGRVDGKNQLFLRALDAPQAQQMPGTEGATYPFWSPDNRYIGFFAQGKLKKILASGGPPQTLCDAPEGRGGSWNRDDVILFSAVDGDGRFAVQSVHAGGGASAMAVKAPKGISRYPLFLPGGRNFLYVVTRASPEENGVYFRSLDGKENRRILPDESTVVFAEGRLLFVRENTLMAQPFDAEKGQTLGDPSQVAAGVSLTSNVVYAPVTASDTGILVYESGGTAAGTQILRFDRGGKVLESLAVKGVNHQPVFSPDGKTLAFMRLSATGSDLWMWDLARGSEQRYVKDPGLAWAPIWSPSGDRILFQSNRTAGIPNLYVRASSGTGEDQPMLVDESRKTPTQWTRDGRLIVYSTIINSKTRDDIWILPIENGKAGKPFVFLHSESNEEFGQLSPDNRWMAYTSDESGRREVYVRTFPAGDDPKRISIDGGEEPRWRGDGKELYFVGADGKFMAVAMKIGSGAKPSIEPSAPQSLFAAPPLAHYITYAYDYDVTSDGKQFVLTTAEDRLGASPPLNMIVNWAAALKK